MQDKNYPSINKLTEPMVQSLIDDAVPLRLLISKLDNGTTIVDSGIKAEGGLEAGRRIAEICMGGLGIVNLRASTHYENWSWQVDVHTSHPVISCLASQYAGWNLSNGEGENAFNALGSGPGRAMGSREELFEEIEYHDQADSTSIIIEADELPPVEIADKISQHCGINSDRLTLILTPTTSLSGGIQVVSRVLETALHKAHTLGFPLKKIIDGAGSTPVCPPSRDFMTAMSRTNDSILFAGQVHLFVMSDDSDAKHLANNLPSSSSKAYGKPFGEIFKEVNYQFYKVDPLLFSPARVSVTSLVSGNTFHAGKIDKELLNKSFSTKCG